MKPENPPAFPHPSGAQGCDGRVNSSVELMGEALSALSDRMRQTDFIHCDSNPITDANAAAYERVVKAWDKLTSAIAKANGL